MRIVIILSLWPAPRKVLAPETPDRGPLHKIMRPETPDRSPPLHEGQPQVQPDSMVKSSDDAPKPREPPPPGQYTSPKFRMQFPSPKFRT